MLDRQVPLDFDEWWSHFWKNDQTIMMTRTEHNQDRDNVECFRWLLSYCNTYWFKYRKTIEGAHLKTMKKFHWLPLKEIKKLLEEH